MVNQFAIKLLLRNIEFQPKSCQLIKRTIYTSYKYFCVGQHTTIFELVPTEHMLYIRLHRYLKQVDPGTSKDSTKHARSHWSYLRQSITQQLCFLSSQCKCHNKGSLNHKYSIYITTLRSVNCINHHVLTQFQISTQRGNKDQICRDSYDITAQHSSIMYHSTYNSIVTFFYLFILILIDSKTVHL